MSHPGILEVAEIYKNTSEICITKNETDNTFKVFFEINSKERIKQKILRHSLSVEQFKNLTDKSTYTSGRIFSEFKKLFKDFNLFSAIKKIACEIKGENYSSNNWNLDVGLEQPPRLTNNLKLHHTKDALGVSKINIFWDDLSKIEKDTVVKSVKTMASELGLLGTGKIKLTNKLLNGQSYKFDDPINLYIAGSSVFTTSSIVNPTYTIIALSLRLGEYLKNIKS